jgi:hypothetical protein
MNRTWGRKEIFGSNASLAFYIALLSVAGFGMAEFADYYPTNMAAAACVVVAAIVMASLGMRRLDLLLLAVIALAPFHSLVRGLSPDSVMLSGWRDVLYIYTVLIWATWLALGRLSLPSGRPAYVILLFNVVGLFEAARAPSLLAGLVSFRDVLKYPMLAFVAEGLCRRYPGFLRRLTMTLFASAAFTAAIQVILYAADKDYVVRMGTDRPINWRSLDLLQIRRMEAFFGGGPSNLGIYLASALAIYLAYRLSRERIPKWWNVAAVVQGFALALTVSFSAIIAVFLTVLLLLTRKGISRRYLVLIAGAVVVLFLIVNAGLTPEMFRADSIENPTFYSYFSVVFFKRLFLGYARQTVASPGTFLMGTGLGIVGNKTFLADAATSGLRVIGDSDGGWAEFALQVGVPMALAILLMIGHVIWRAYRTARYFPSEQRNAIWAILGACVAMLTSIHIVPWIRVGSDVDFWIVIGGLIYAARKGDQLRVADMQSGRFLMNERGQ